MDAVWAVVVVAIFAFAFALVALVLLARTAWSAMRNRAELDQIEAANRPTYQPEPRPSQLHRIPFDPDARRGAVDYAGGVPVMPDDDEEMGT